jgi:hypothetical protein
VRVSVRGFFFPSLDPHANLRAADVWHSAYRGKTTITKFDEKFRKYALRFRRLMLTAETQPVCAVQMRAMRFSSATKATFVQPL